MPNLKEIKEALVWGANIEGKDYAHKALDREDINWLIDQVEKYQRENIYKSEGMAIFVKGNFSIGIHPDNLQNNLRYLAKGNMSFDWKTIAKNNGIEID